MDASIVKSFLVLAETLSFSKAADTLFKTQSVLSRQISRFEKELGVKLFNRNSKSVSLTPAGKLYAEGLRTLGDTHSALLQEVLAVQAGFTGEVRIAAVPGQMIHHSFAGILRGFERAYPKIMVSLTAYNLSEQRHLLLERKIDLVFGTSLNFRYIPELSCAAVGKAKLGVYVTINHPAIENAPATFADFRNDTFIILSEYEEPNIVKLFSRHFEAVDYIPAYIIAPDMATLMLWLEADRGVAILDDTHVFSDNPFLSFVNIPELG
jgi:DNA-binding transcriptional LysR family regulator